MIGSIQKSPIDHIAQLLQLPPEIFTILGKHWIKETTYILDHECPWSHLIHQAHRIRKQIPLISPAQLLSRHREWRARQSASQQVDPPIGTTIETGKIGLFVRLDAPGGTIQDKRIPAMMIDLDQYFVPETCLFQTKSLATSSGANLYR